MKQAKVKKTNYSSKNATVNSNEEISKLIKIVVIIITLFIVFYLITVLVTKEKELESEKVPTTIQYDKILIGEMLNQDPESYYVIITREDDEYVSLYANYLYIYSMKENSLRYYTANLDDVFNNSYLAEEANIEVTTLNGLKLNSTTLVKVSNKKISAIYNEKETIISQLEEMIK